MTMFRIIVKETEETDEMEFDFMAGEFAIANAAFAACASNGINNGVWFYMIEGDRRTLLSDMAMFKEGLRQHRMAQMSLPGTPPQFRA